jgi:hypothetical protein
MSVTSPAVEAPILMKTPEKHPGKGEEKALTEAVRNTTAVPQQGNDDFLAQGKYFP